MSSAVTMRSGLPKSSSHGCSKPGIRRLETENQPNPLSASRRARWHLHRGFHRRNRSPRPATEKSPSGGCEFRLSSNMRRFLMEMVAARFVVSKVAAHFRTFHYGGVIFISRENVIWRGFEGVFRSSKQRFRLLLTVDNPIGVKNLVAAVLGVRLGERTSSMSFGLRPSFVKASCR